jgi:hypothetical protein
MNIIELTKQAEEYANNVVQSNDNDYPWGFLRYQKFAALVEAAARADEREECAKLCDEVGKESASHWPYRFANMIRARGTT